MRSWFSDNAFVIVNFAFMIGIWLSYAAMQSLTADFSWWAKGLSYLAAVGTWTLIVRVTVHILE